MITAVDCSILRFNKELLIPEYFVYYSKSILYDNQIQPLCTGSTRKRISRKNLGKIEIPLPSLEEQKRIVDLLNDTFTNTKIGKEKAQLQFELYNSLEKSSLQEAFNGRL